MRVEDAPLPSLSIRADPEGGAAVTTREVLVWDEDTRHALDWGSELAAAAPESPRPSNDPRGSPSSTEEE